MKTLLLILFTAFLLNAQNYKVEKVNGNVKVQISGSEEWKDVKTGNSLPSNSLLFADENSSIQLSGSNGYFVLKGSSALVAGSIKNITLEELILALAMEEILNTPKKKDNNTTQTTAVYGTEQIGKTLDINSGEFGIKRLNGAKQLAESGFKESALISAKEIYRKYPQALEFIEHRIYFADILIEMEIYDEAYTEFEKISKLKLNEKEKKSVIDKIEYLKKKLALN